MKATTHHVSNGLRLLALNKPRLSRHIPSALRTHTASPFVRQRNIAFPRHFASARLLGQESNKPLSPQAHAEARQKALAADAAKKQPYRPAPHRRPDEPVYELTFTCKACSTRSSHTLSKQGYHRGTVLIQCPGCKNRHLIADHLHIFTDQATTLEDIMESQGDRVQKGTINTEGDIELWKDDDTQPSSPGVHHSKSGEI